MCFSSPLHRKMSSPERARGKKTLGSYASAIVLVVLGILMLLVPLGFLAVTTTQQLADLLKSGAAFFEANADKLKNRPSEPDRHNAPVSLGRFIRH